MASGAVLRSMTVTLLMEGKICLREGRRRSGFPRWVRRGRRREGGSTRRRGKSEASFSTSDSTLLDNASYDK